MSPQRVAKCGTNSGYASHIHKKETPCRPCKDAHTAYNREKYRAKHPPKPLAPPKPPKPPREPAPCGTNAAYRRHLYRKETPCDACRAGHSAYKKELERNNPPKPRTAKPRKAKPRKAPETTPPECGTTAGYTHHIKSGETPCDACREAKRAYAAEWRRRTNRTKATLYTDEDIQRIRDQAFAAGLQAGLDLLLDAPNWS